MSTYTIYRKAGILAILTTLLSTPSLASTLVYQAFHDPHYSAIEKAYQRLSDTNRYVSQNGKTIYIETPAAHRLSLRDSSVNMLISENSDRTEPEKRLAVQRFLAAYQGENFVTESQLLKRLNVK